MDASAWTGGNVTFYGGDGNDVLKGGSGNDYFDGGNGDDQLFGNGGNDTLLGDAGNNVLNGGAGDDTIYSNYFATGTSQDVIDGGTGNDNLYAYAVNSLAVANGSITINGGAAGANNLEAIQANGTPGNDTMDASAWTGGNVSFSGLDGNDVLKGGSGNDYLDGGNGDDQLFGNGGSDTLIGDDGNDTITDGGAETNSLDGGNGTDSLFYLATPGNDTIQLSSNSITVNGATATYYNFENLTFDAGAGIDQGTQIGTMPPYVFHNLEPTVDAGTDVSSSVNPFVRTGSFTDIGDGQSWTATADYGEGDGPVAIPVNQVAHTFSLNHTYANGGIFTIRVRVIDNEGNVGTSTFHLQRSGIEVGVAGGIQRSMVEKLFVYFDDTMTLNPGWFTLDRLSPGATPTVNATSEVVNGKTIATLTFSGDGLDTGNSLQDGNWRLTLNGAFIITSTGQQYDGDADGNPGGNYVFNFHRLFGDANGDRTVDGSDFSLFGNSFGLTNGQAGFNPAFDGNVDGTVDGTDFAQFGNRFGITLPCGFRP